MASLKIGIQLKLFVYFLVIISMTMASGGFIIEEFLVHWRMENIQISLLRHLRFIELMAKEIPPSVLHEHYPQLAKRMGDVLDMRVTFIDEGGWVVGDSAVSSSQLSTVENHKSRPEVQQALSHEAGTSTRHSSTTSEDLYYMAYVARLGEDRVVIRLARPLHDLQNEISQLRMLILSSLLVAFVLAAFMSGMASRMATRSLRTMVQQTARITGGDQRSRLEISSQDEIGGLAASFNTVLNHLEQLMASVALERDRLKAVLEGIVDGVMALDAYGRIILANHAVIQVLSLKMTPVSRFLEEILPRDQVDGLVPPYSDKVYQGEIELKLKGGGSKRIQVTAVPTQSDRGLIILMRDVTERHRMQQVQRDFIASASHELRTPVSIVRLNAETLLDGALEEHEMAITLVEAIFRQSLRLSQLIGDLLDLSRLESGSHHLNLTMVSAFDVLGRVEEGLFNMMESKNICYINQIPDELMVFADPSAFEQILTNLVGNAIKYTPADGQVEVKVKRLAGDWVCFMIQDNGPGIPEEHHPLLFNRFYRVDPGRSREMGGTGLGLAIVKHLVEAMAGKVGLDAVEPHGCCFWFTLPLHSTLEKGAVSDDDGTHSHDS
ncbi:MAG: HAMP domain-containing protein [Magnetococcales bacterium]|nr:HAMP domain-containing protein [Magnetococcales bacterium]NGZ25921.1 HAMP domain-containing protein [Magnetococcales bacterium]